MKIDFQDRTWQLDYMDADYRQSLVITESTGLTMAGWEKACADPDHPKWLTCIACLYWLMLEQNGKEIDLDEIPGFAPLRFYQALAAAVAAEAADAAVVEEDPTKPPGGNAAESPAQAPAADSLPGS